MALGGIGGAAALAAPVPPAPIPNTPGATAAEFTGKPARPDPVAMPAVPRHPYMARNGLSNTHDDAYQSDTYRWRGPLGRSTVVSSTENVHECGTLTFDSQGRLVTVCVGVAAPFLAMVDPNDLSLLAEMPLPPRTNVGPDFTTDFSGGGYFYLDHYDRAVVPTTTRHLLVISETDGPAGPGFQTQKDFDVSGAVPIGDGIVSALPDWRGRIWFVSKKGVVGNVDPNTLAVSSVDLGSPIGNSFAVDEEGGVYVVSDAQLYRFEAGAGGAPRVIWRHRYPNIGQKKPGQTEIGSGTTPTLMGQRFVAITDNADPMNVMVFRRGRHVRRGRRVLCSAPVFAKGASDTDQSLIGTDTAMIVENNYGYTGVAKTNGGGVTSPGLERVDIVGRGHGRYACRKVWHSSERAPSVVPKLSLAAGLVYTYTKPPDPENDDAWYLTALDFDTGRTVYRRLSGTGLGHNNHYAPIILAATGDAYVATFGGIVRFHDTR
ncbi:MAG: hypothetical protein QOJ38_406 [Solirubrobacterales bacterium]|nr:hypothetical protein [Solirubrobacterales bacterium]